MTSQRIQRKRTKGWRMPEGAVFVGRPSRWGNPFHVEADRPFMGEPTYRCTVPTGFNGSFLGREHDRATAHRQAAELFERALTEPTRDIHLLRDPWLTVDDVRAALAGRDLVCWCPLYLPCHADVLLAIANDGGSP